MYKQFNQTNKAKASQLNSTTLQHIKATHTTQWNHPTYKKYLHAQSTTVSACSIHNSL